MAETATAIVNKPAWVDLAAKDAAAAREFYSKVFRWNVEVNPDPQYGGYGLAKVNGNDAAGIGGQMSPDAPTAWTLYIGTDDLDALAQRVTANGGTVAMPPFDVGDQGQDGGLPGPDRAFISSWQGTRMGGFQTTGPNAFGWADLSTRGVDKAVPFYENVFGWSPKRARRPSSRTPSSRSTGSRSQVRPRWPPTSRRRCRATGWSTSRSMTLMRRIDACRMRAARWWRRSTSGGRMSIVSDPQGAAFGLMTLKER